MAVTNVQAFSGDVVVDDGVYHPLTIDPTNSMIYNKSLYFPGIGADTYNYLGRFRIYAPPAIFNIWDSGTALGSGSRYSMSKAWGSTQAPVMNALEGSEFSTYNFYWEPEAAGGASEESVFYHVWFSPSRAGDYTFYIHAKEYQFPTEPSSPTYNDVIYGMLNLLGSNGTQSHVVVGRPSVSGNATLQLHNESQTTGDRLTHEAIQLFSNTTPSTGEVSNVFITMTPSISNGGYGGYIEGWIESGTGSGLSLGGISSGTKNRGLTVQGATSRVGIGTTNPVAPLHIGDYTTGSAGELLRLSGASTADRHFKFLNEDDAAVGGAGSNAVWVHDVNSSFGQYSFRTANTELMRIKNNGNVGIGTSNPSQALTLFRSGGTLLFQSNDNFERQSAAARDAYFTSATHKIERIADNDLLYSGGGLLLGSTHQIELGYSKNYTLYAPDTKYGPSQHAMRFNMTNPGASTTSYNIMTLLSSGTVGIGTTNPGQTLDVNGDFRCGNFHAIRTGGFAKFATRQVSGSNITNLSDQIRINGFRRAGWVRAHYSAGLAGGNGSLQHSAFIVVGFSVLGDGSIDYNVLSKVQHTTTNVSMSSNSSGYVTLSVNTGSNFGSYVTLYTEWFYDSGIYPAV
jgi:hypothetical protein